MSRDKPFPALLRAQGLPAKPIPWKTKLASVAEDILFSFISIYNNGFIVVVSHMHKVYLDDKDPSRLIAPAYLPGHISLSDDASLGYCIIS